MVDYPRLRAFMQGLKQDQVNELVAALLEVEDSEGDTSEVPGTKPGPILKIMCTRAEFEELLEKLVEAAHEGKVGYMATYQKLLSLVVSDAEDRPFLV